MFSIQHILSQLPLTLMLLGLQPVCGSSCSQDNQLSCSHTVAGNIKVTAEFGFFTLYIGRGILVLFQDEVHVLILPMAAFASAPVTLGSKAKKATVLVSGLPAWLNGNSC